MTVLIEAYPERSFPGQVDRIGVKADPQTNTFEVEVLVANPDLLLKAGLTATVNIIEAAAGLNWRRRISSIRRTITAYRRLTIGLR